MDEACRDKSHCLIARHLKQNPRLVLKTSIVFYNKLSWFVSELPEKDISNVVVQCRVVFNNKLSWFVSELPEKDISNMVV